MRPDCENLRRGDDQRGVALREPVLVVQEDDAEPDHRDLGVDVDAAPECETPETAVAQRARERLLPELVLLAVPAPDEGDAHDRAERAQGREEEDAASRISGRGQVRDDERRDEPAERNRGLPHAECKPSLVGREPVHDRAPAGRVHACSRASGERQQQEERVEVGGVRCTDQKCRAGGETEPEDDPLAEAVRSDAPREHGDEGADPLRTQQHADLAQRQVVLLPERGHEDRQPDRERGEARLSDRPGREDSPAVAHPASVRGGEVAYEMLRRSEPERLTDGARRRDDPPSSRGRDRASRARAPARSRTACSPRTGSPGTPCTAC
jgi:hypothetical protein